MLLEMRTTIRMDSALARDAKKFAAKHGMSFTALIERAVSELIAKGRSSTRRRSIRLPTYGDPSKKLTAEQIQRAIDQAQLEDDVRSLGTMRDDAA